MKNTLTNFWRQLLVLTSLTIAASSYTAQAQTAEQTELLNVAVRQQMLAERLTRTHAMRVLKVLNERAAYQIGEDEKRFTKQLAELRKAKLKPEIHDNYEHLAQLWQEFSGIVTGEPTRENLDRLAEQNEELVYIAEKGATMLSETMKTPRAEIIIEAGRAATLSQRMAKIYFLRSLGLRAKFLANDLATAEAEYTKAIAALKVAAANNPAALKELELIDQQWLFFSTALRTLDSGRDAEEQRANMAKTSDNLLSALDSLGLRSRSVTP